MRKIKQIKKCGVKIEIYKCNKETLMAMYNSQIQLVNYNYCMQL